MRRKRKQEKHNSVAEKSAKPAAASAPTIKSIDQTILSEVSAAQSTSDKSAEIECTKELVRVEKAQLRVNALLTLATFVAVGVAIYTSRSSLQFATVNARIDQRAWLTVESARLVTPLTAGLQPKVELSILNGGKTPALDVRIVPFIGVGATGSDNISSVSGGQNGEWPHAVIGPNSRATVTFNGSVLADDEIKMVHESIQALYSTGCIEYRDIFGETVHRTHFCYSIRGDILGTMNLGACERGNTLDDNITGCP